jgi:sulfur carrier protein ThiS
VRAGSRAKVRLELPSVLGAVTGWRRLEVEAGTINDVLEAAFERTPVLRHHLTQASGELRPHVLCVLNDVTIPRERIRGTALSDGDVVMIHQAISGG